ncbi:MAG: hypothetical protein ACLR8L_09590 [Oscillospiraceae bacterium]
MNQYRKTFEFFSTEQQAAAFVAARKKAAPQGVPDPVDIGRRNRTQVYRMVLHLNRRHKKMNGDYGTLVINTGNINHYHSCDDEQYNAEYLNGIGFSWEKAIEIAAWAALAPVGAAYEQDELEKINIYII